MKRILVISLLQSNGHGSEPGACFFPSQGESRRSWQRSRKHSRRSAPAKPKQARKVLLFSKTNGFRHGSIPVGVASLTMLGKPRREPLTATHSEDEAMFEPATLKQFDAVIMVNTTGELFRPKKLPADAAQKKAALEREERLKKEPRRFCP